MSDTNISPWLKRIEKTLEMTIQSIRAAVNAKSVVVIVVHQDATTQSSASVTPGTEHHTALALRAMAARIEKGEISRVEMSPPFKN